LTRPTQEPGPISGEIEAPAGAARYVAEVVAILGGGERQPGHWDPAQTEKPLNLDSPARMTSRFDRRTPLRLFGARSAGENTGCARHGGSVDLNGGRSEAIIGIPNG
jgi:hypothetical protein